MELHQLDGYADLPQELKDMEALLARQDAMKARLMSAPLLDAKLPCGERDCGTVKGCTINGGPNDRDDEVCWSILAMSAADDPNCQADPLGYTLTITGDERVIEVYWPKVA